MRVLVTGAAGFIGSAVCDLLRDRGHDVVAVDALIPEAWASSSAPPVDHRLDVRDAASWVALLTGVDAVCHQAAMVGAGVRVSDLPSYAGHNDLGTACLLAAMYEAGVRHIVLASSMVVYGEGRYNCEVHGETVPSPREVGDLDAGRFDNRCPACEHVLDWTTVDEDARLDPRSAYAASKVAQEHYTAAWARQAGGRATALRYHNVYGPRMPKDTPYSGVAAIFRSSIERGEPPQVFEDGRQMRDFVHVSDVARANLLALEAVTGDRGPSYDAINVCSGRAVSIGEVARLLGSVEPLVTGRYRLGDVRHVVASPARALAVLGFEAAVDPATGLAEFSTAPLR